MLRISLLDHIAYSVQFSSFQSLSHVWLFATLWTAARQASLAITNSKNYSDSCPLNRWCHPTISFFVTPFSSCLQSLPESGSFPVSWLIRWPKYWNFSIIPSSEYSGLISFKKWLVWSPCSPRDSQESSPAPQFESINSTALSLLYSPTLTSVHDYWKNHSFVYTDFCQQSDVSAF